MDIFVKKYQPEIYEFWRLGIDHSSIDSVDNTNRKRTNTLYAKISKDPKNVFQIYLSKINKYSEDDSGDNLARKPLNMNVWSVLPKYLKTSISKHFPQPINISSLATKSAKVSFDMLKRIEEQYETDVIKAKQEVDTGDSQDETLTNNTVLSQLVLSDLILDDSSEEGKTNTGSMSASEFNKQIQIQNQKCEHAFNEQLNSTHSSDEDMYKFLKKSIGLWHFQKSDTFNLEHSVAVWNEKKSHSYPHCVVCLQFSQHRSNRSELKYADSVRLPANSEICVPEVCFSAKAIKIKSKASTNNSLSTRSGIDCLLQCKMCKVTVHQSCYVGNLSESHIYGGGGAEGANNWLCDKCIGKMTHRTRAQTQPNESSCSLCLLHGGALKIMSSN